MDFDLLGMALCFPGGHFALERLVIGNPPISALPLVVFPEATSTLVVLAFNFFGDAIRDAVDPKLRGGNSLMVRA